MEPQTHIAPERGAPMPVVAEAATDESAGKLVAGMAQDAKRLGDQYATLAKLELEQLSQALGAIIIKALVGSVLAVLALLFAGLAVGGAVEEWDLAPRWVGLAAYAGLLFVAGAIFLITIRSSAEKARE